MAQWSVRAAARSAARSRNDTGALRALLLVAVFLGVLAWPVPESGDAPPGQAGRSAVTAVPARYGGAAWVLGRGLPPWATRDTGVEQHPACSGGAALLPGGELPPPGVRRGPRPVAPGASALPPHEWPHPGRAPPAPAGA